jgi:hypothetical protein
VDQSVDQSVDQRVAVETLVETSCTAVAVMYATSPVAGSSARSMGIVSCSVSCNSCPYRAAPTDALRFDAAPPKSSASCQCLSEDVYPLPPRSGLKCG